MPAAFIEVSLFDDSGASFGMRQGEIKKTGTSFPKSGNVI
jgi:hypothetical protein